MNVISYHCLKVSDPCHCVWDHSLYNVLWGEGRGSQGHQALDDRRLNLRAASRADELSHRPVGSFSHGLAHFCNGLLP